MLPVDREKTLGEHVYAQLKRALMTGAFQPGQKVTVRAMADAMSVSFTPAREGLSRLLAEGVLENKGPKTVVVPVLTRDRLEEITRIRIALEGMAAEYATPGLGAPEIEQLELVQIELIAAMDRGDYKTVLARNEIFHFMIYAKAGMPNLLGMIETMWLRIGPSLNLIYPEFATKRAGVDNHRGMLGHLRRGDAAGVREAVEQDIKDGFATLSKSIG